MTADCASTRAARAEEGKQRFLRAYEFHWNISEACRQVSVPRENVYYWLEFDPAFKAAFDAVQNAVKSELQGLALGRARQGSDTLIKFLLEKLDPVTFGRRSVPATVPQALPDVGGAVPPSFVIENNIGVQIANVPQDAGGTVAEAEARLLERIRGMSPHPLTAPTKEPQLAGAA